MLLKNKSIEYLFYGVDTKMQNEIYRAMEEGFRSPAEYSRMGVSQDVSLVNSIAAADSPRIYSFIKSEDSSLLLRSNTSPSKSFGKSSIANIIDNIPSGHILV